MTSSAAAVSAWWQVSDRELAAALIEGEAVARCHHARMLEALGEAVRRGMAVGLGYRGITGFLREELHLSAVGSGGAGGGGGDPARTGGRR
ncbi:hypothetical protein [Qaidamihabitans albus]|uniref:hypothetical protein n=1 Tax=Qaidamihabitans albus TaxID=2795733 RepID=UPI0018F22C31|nr:hypothetical protein [Qaidamihabitans albus]